MGDTPRVALVTGAAQGIGAEVARVLAGEATIAALDTNAEGLLSLVAELRGKGQRATAWPVSVSDASAVETVVERIEKELGPIHTLVNVAGVLRMNPVVSLSDEDWATTFGVNTNGVFHVSRAVARRMVPRRAGVIVTVGSNAAGTPRMQMAAYAASKAASTMFTKCLGLELAQYGIRCNVVSPGSTDTAMQRGMWKDEHGADAVIAGASETFRVGIPLRRIATPRDIAEAVQFLASDRARHITMHDLCVDGGATLGV
ncbi:2,3-dihydro-2,3-dihydroxybenzoate dehydrogenase [Myxococcus sp. CA051A]|uniref:2,3-dihydro-2,3-dihydroxybenzoate dehydrogenase n=1 Tax=Myxococcus llanfairpwllgwyngyllgogerychwyrndrobwllllantysiliogogogochensis TaxID=2590453 RepID=A0A540WQI3_9BACT|nr:MULTISPECIES: 2,3-dihydro-2,3-dihydroxybenzoate dehydrogenase [Myxococcus]NTX06824.1 2,3-dihydro-2,3-dihydroxybenzoate dehydrogenase [Myxococcus sp. CA040A]NTX13867.1 2,3-dihydro-2,3-dihydroxybenzoate dehydrogenase [Myxococcus sp. CA056]NTX38454.1 2,3-dihydro-2,3-dihydroxybenzoate dehydrogenase [Myxococcus sp. CA033]NTX62482.1 2,3-dihydro-2,3-dihydroxybenzoate dehydrogenase [Myxococcus sp. CA051A]TQF11272.1 2,3-dihydro-2,3-dihydroxybenzoate dehydrogenase [Myxococcus llanfairpwllgwyngyllgoge